MLNLNNLNNIRNISNIHKIHKRYGFTLIEMMIAVLINTVLLLVFTAAFNNAVNNYSSTQVNIDTLTQQLQMAVDLMTNEIRRAGYSSTAATNIGNQAANTNPFMQPGTTDVSVSSGNCILFTYDHANNGTLPLISNGSTDDDRYGYRLSNNTLQTRPPGATFSCGAPSSAWENLTNPQTVKITAFTVTLNQQQVPTSGSTYMILRSVDISMSGQLVSNAAANETISFHVKIRNDKFL